MTDNGKWYKNPQGIVAAIAIATTLLGFFYVREKQMWETSARINMVETRGTNAITSVDQRLQRIEQAISDTRSQVNFMERKIDRLEIIFKELQESRGKGYDPTIQQ